MTRPTAGSSHLTLIKKSNITVLIQWFMSDWRNIVHLKLRKRWSMIQKCSYLGWIRYSLFAFEYHTWPSAARNQTWHFDTTLGPPQPQYSALPISRGHLFPNNSRKTPMARPLGLNMGVFHEFKIWPNFALEVYTVSNIVLYCTAICREYIVL